MTDNEIIKALEEYRNSKIVQSDNGVISIGNILDLINRQQAEIERLNSPVLIIDNVDLSENEIAEKLRNLPVQIFPDNEEQIRNEAIKEFAERLKENVESYDVFDGYKITIRFAVEEDTIDNLVKEMVGDTE